MLLKQTTIALLSTSSNSLTSSCKPRLRSSLQTGQPADRIESNPRFYATIHTGADQNRAGRNLHLRWPASPEPTPYEIFNISNDAKYSKTRFYELVKLYHPDRQHHTKHDGIPHLAKLERYRLVVAANDILSDPSKRRLYDLYGAGWEGKSNMRSKYRAADRRWREEPGNASMNATWEDWERWYQERDGKKQEPVYMSNGSFVGVIVIFILIGGWGQVTRAGSHSTSLVEQRDQRHAAISQDMRRKQTETSGLSKQDRVESFLRQRKGWDYGVQPGHSDLSHDTTNK